MKLGSSTIKLAIGGVVVAGMLGAAVTFGGQLLPIEIRIGATSAESATSGHGVASASAEKNQPGITFPLSERVVNLADTGGLRYLKIGIGLEFSQGADEKSSGGGHGGASDYKKQQEEFGKKL